MQSATALLAEFRAPLVPLDDEALQKDIDRLLKAKPVQQFNVSKFLQLTENIEDFLSPEFWSQSWNNGIVE